MVNPNFPIDTSAASSMLQQAYSSAGSVGAGALGGSAFGPLGIAAGVAGSAVSAGLNALTAKRNAKLQYKYWKKMFDYQSDYNSPVKQLQRLYDAGINPLYDSQFGGNQSFGGMIGSLPESVGDSLSPALAQFLDLMMKNRELDISESRADAQNEADRARASEAAGNAKLTELKSYTEIPRAVAEIKAIEAQTDKTKEDINYLESLRSQIKQQIVASRQEILQNWSRVLNAFRQSDIEFFKAEANKSLGWYNAVTDRNFKEASIKNESRNLELRDSDLYRAWEKQEWSYVADAVQKATSTIYGVKVLSQTQFESVMRTYSTICDGLSAVDVNSIPRSLLDNIFELSSAVASVDQRLASTILTRPKKQRGHNENAGNAGRDIQ